MLAMSAIMTKDRKTVPVETSEKKSQGESQEKPSRGVHARLGGRPGVARVAQVLRVAGGHGSAWDVALLLEEGRGRPDDRLKHN